MNFLDMNTFYYGSDGGIKTFYDAKMKWFSSHPEHRYTLIHPGPRFSARKISHNVQIIEVFGLKGIIGKNRLLMLDYITVYKMIRKIDPDSIEAGDPLFTSLFLIFLLKFRLFKGIITSFHHSDPINTYIMPWAFGKNSNILKKIIAKICCWLFLSTQRSFQYSMVASHSIQSRLQKMGLSRIFVFPFGVDMLFKKTSRLRKNGEKQILFAGRLEHEKGIYLLKKIIFKLLEKKDVSVGVVGKGSHEHFFNTLTHRNFKYYGYIDNREKMALIYHEHSIFLAPGPFETFGIAVLEALTSGMIVVGASTGGTSEILTSMNSPFKFKANNPDSFLTKIEMALNSDIAVESRRSLNSAESFLSWDEAIEKMIGFYLTRHQSRIIILNEKKNTPSVA